MSGLHLQLQTLQGQQGSGSVAGGSTGRVGGLDQGLDDLTDGDVSPCQLLIAAGYPDVSCQLIQKRKKADVGVRHCLIIEQRKRKA